MFQFIEGNKSRLYLNEEKENVLHLLSEFFTNYNLIEDEYILFKDQFINMISLPIQLEHRK